MLRGVVRAINVGHNWSFFGHAFYFSENLLLPSSLNYHCSYIHTKNTQKPEFTKSTFTKRNTYYNFRIPTCPMLQQQHAELKIFNILDTIYGLKDSNTLPKFKQKIKSWKDTLAAADWTKSDMMACVSADFVGAFHKVSCLEHIYFQ